MFCRGTLAISEVGTPRSDDAFLNFRFICVLVRIVIPARTLISHSANLRPRAPGGHRLIVRGGGSDPIYASSTLLLSVRWGFPRDVFSSAFMNSITLPTSWIASGGKNTVEQWGALRSQINTATPASSLTMRCNTCDPEGRSGWQPYRIFRCSYSQFGRTRRLGGI